MKIYRYLILLIIIIAGCSPAKEPAQPIETAQQAQTPTVKEPAAPPLIAPPSPQEACTSQECFIEKANKCENAELTLTQKSGTFKYSLKNCTLTKTLVELQDADPQEIRTQFEGKNLTCRYRKDNFNPQWVSSLIFGLEYCKGDLKNSLASLLVFD